MDSSKLNVPKIAEADFNGRVKNKIKASSELWRIFLFTERPDVKAIVHCHSEWASIVSCQRLKYLVSLYGCGVGGVDIKCAKYSILNKKLV